ncbi:MAG: hypothetical protein U9N53_12370, partial [Bacteroidota bacterium]|nr:hypothetical protein [Bacteroidota bacterium]
REIIILDAQGVWRQQYIYMNSQLLADLKLELHYAFTYNMVLKIKSTLKRTKEWVVIYLDHQATMPAGRREARCWFCWN